jgi:hypothetical protein
MMKIGHLQPLFLKRQQNPTGEGDAISYVVVDNIGDADGLDMLCPKCLFNNKGERAGVHSIICWDPKVAPDVDPGPGRWRLEGTGMSDLTLGPQEPGGLSSVLLDSGCRAHFHVRNGAVINCDAEPSWATFNAEEPPQLKKEIEMVVKYRLVRPGKKGTLLFETEQEAADARPNTTWAVEPVKVPKEDKEVND